MFQSGTTNRKIDAVGLGVLGIRTHPPFREIPKLLREAVLILNIHVDSPWEILDPPLGRTRENLYY